MNKIENYFKSYPNVDKLYSTSDGQVFTDMAKAETHSQRLKNTKVSEHVRNVETISDSSSAEEKLLQVDFTDEAKLKQADLLKLAKVLEIDIADNKKETLIVALKAKQEELKSKKFE